MSPVTPGSCKSHDHKKEVPPGVHARRYCITHKQYHNLGRLGTSVAVPNKVGAPSTPRRTSGFTEPALSLSKPALSVVEGGSAQPTALVR